MPDATVLGCNSELENAADAFVASTEASAEAVAALLLPSPLGLLRAEEASPRAEEDVLRRAEPHRGEPLREERMRGEQKVNNYVE